MSESFKVKWSVPMQKVIQFSIACWYPQTLLIKSISISSSAFIIILSFLNRRLSLLTENSQLPFPDIFLQWITFIECFCFIFRFPKERKWRSAWIKKIGYPRWKASDRTYYLLAALRRILFPQNEKKQNLVRENDTTLKIPLLLKGICGKLLFPFNF